MMRGPRCLPISVSSLADQIRAACLLECTARKPGNVHPNAAFADICYADFVTSAEVSAPILAESRERGIGSAIREAVIATRAAVGSNTNLGMLLLLGPLAAIPVGVRCEQGIEAALDSLDLQQTAEIYEAIRLAQPGGLGKAASQDVSTAPTVLIRESMALAPHDRIAWQYTHRFEDALGFGRERLLELTLTGTDWEQAVVRLHIELIARQSDSLILRKCGAEIAKEAQKRALTVLQQWEPGQSAPEALMDFDRWLRADGHRRNPGTTADLLAGILFAAIRDGDFQPPEYVGA
ncbi:triphosphoribosyl-dephospho-CoA synthase [Planctomicrobium sp. SH661]|uniref:triphosphoribosyl-dephospho-CoA synthase n=1 Tax=Planctomicrobium sp. SH661 TaxID=3448124 RepID=UPI003F5BC0B3